MFRHRTTDHIRVTQYLHIVQLARPMHEGLVWVGDGGKLLFNFYFTTIFIWTLIRRRSHRKFMYFAMRVRRSRYPNSTVEFVQRNSARERDYPVEMLKIGLLTSLRVLLAMRACLSRSPSLVYSYDCVHRCGRRLSPVSLRYLSLPNV